MSAANGSKGPGTPREPRGGTGAKPSRGAPRPRGSSGATPPRTGAARLARFLPVAPSGGAQAARTPFVLLVVLLLGGGLIMLLMLNSSLNEGSFRLSKLKKQTTELTDDEQELQREVDSYSAPDALLRRARELGMVPGGDPAFLSPSGIVKGNASPAAAPAPVRRPASPPATPAGSPTPSTGASPQTSAKPDPKQSAPPRPQTPSAPAPSTSGR
ncbi:septum formation initiator family protein [Streptomyces sp. NPDC050145]|uniref:septum formation initiator family protein n=1 Tax=Streptomyces sp. NPDC050145 TaxID=3365602 RepID=UPI0037AE810D